MIEVYLFFAVFPVQLLAMSVLYPAAFARLMRTTLANIPLERLAELYPGVDVGRAHERFLAWYRAGNSVVAVIGLALLGWFISYMQQPAWDEGRVGGVLTAFFLLQYFPIMMIAWFTTRFDKVHKRSSPDAKRKALLQRRGPLDFVSPYMVLLAVLSYFLFVAFNFYIAQHPFPGYAGPFVNITIVTMVFVLGGFAMYWFVYGRKPDPLQTHADRMGMFRVVVNTYAWVCILMPIFLSLHFARKLLDLETWGPFAGTVGFLIYSFLSLRSVAGRPRQPEAEALRSSPVPR
jgi:MFS family permease